MSVGIVQINMNSNIRKPPGLNSMKSNFSIDSIMSSKPHHNKERRQSGGSPAHSRHEVVSTSSPPPANNRVPFPSEPNDNIRRLDRTIDRITGPSADHRTTERLTDHHTHSPPASPTDNSFSYKSRATTPPPSYRPYPAPQSLPIPRQPHLPHLHRHQTLPPHKHLQGLSGLKSIPPHLTPPYHPSQLSAIDQINALYAQQNTLVGLGSPGMPCGPLNGASTGVSLHGLQKHYSPLQIPMYAPWPTARPGFGYPPFPGWYYDIMYKKIVKSFSQTQ